MELFHASDIIGDSLTLGLEEATHCVKVLRHGVGDLIDVVDGRGTLYHCHLVRISPKGVETIIDSSEQAWGAHPYKLTMAVSPTKNNERYEWFVEKAVEIGVDEIVPIIGEHSERKMIRADRLERIVVSAAKQSLKAAFPYIAEPVGVNDFIASAPASALKLIAYCFDGPKVSISEALSATVREVVMMIGPEGDFSPAEVSFAIRNGFLPVHLGSSRLRTETAAVTACAAVYLKFMA